MRWTPVLLVLVLAAGCGAGGPGAAASCVGPTVSIAPSSVRSGGDVVVTVEWLREGCNDYSGADEERALSDVPVTFAQGEVRVPLGTVSGTGETSGAQLTVRLPGLATPGPARVLIGDDDRLVAHLTVTP